MAKRKDTVNIADGYDYGVLKIRDKETGRVRSSRGCGDAVARAMLAFTAGGGDLVTVVNSNKLQERMAPHLKKKGPKAPGLVRMTLGVMLRALVRNGTPVKIGRETIAKLGQKVELPKIEAAPHKRGVTKTRKAGRPAKRKYVRRANGAEAADAA